MLKKSKVLGTLLLLWSLIMSPLLPLHATEQPNVKANGVDYSNKVVVADWNLYDINGDALSTTNEAKYLEGYRLWLEWSLTMDAGTLLQEGDHFSLPIPNNNTTGFWNYTASDYQDFYNQTGTVKLGKWNIEFGNINVVFYDTVNGAANITGVKFTSGSATFKNHTIAGGIQTVHFGGINKQINFEQRQLEKLSALDSKWATATSNNTVRWAIALNNKGAREITSAPLGQNFTVLKNVYVEDKVEGKIDDIQIRADIMAPVSLSSGDASNVETYSPTVTSYFTKKTPKLNQTYADFKTSLKSLEYGIYVDIDGSQTAIINFGDIGNNNIKYSSIAANFAQEAATQAISNGYYSESDRNNLETYFNTTYGDTNVIGGNVVRYRVYIDDTYGKVVTDTTKYNTANLYKDQNIESVTGAGTMQGIVGVATVDKFAARIYKYDVDTNEIIEGAKFKLQYQSSGTWVDYIPASGASELMTNDAGYVEFTSLPLGVYRFVETAAASAEYDLVNSEGYDAVLGLPVSEEFTISASDTMGHILSLSNTKFSYTVTYNGNGHTAGIEPVDTDNPYKATESVTVLAEGTLTKANYLFTGWNSKADGTGTSYATGETFAMPTTNVTLYAQWKAINKYNVTYDGNGHTTGIAPIDPASPYQTSDTVTVLDEGTLTKTNYLFTGWNTKADGTGTSYVAGATFAMPAANVILYAQWEAMPKYDVIYDGNGHTAGTAPIDSASPYMAAETVTILGVGTLTKTNHLFTGWNSLPDGSGMPYAVNDTISMPTANITLYAQWEAVPQYTVTYDGNGHTTGTAPIDANNPYVASDVVIVLGVGTLVRTNYTFTSWNTKADGTGTPYTIGDAFTMPSTNVTLYAQWEEVQVTPQPPVTPLPEEDNTTHGLPSTGEVITEQIVGAIIILLSGMMLAIVATHYRKKYNN